jgi:hypothetical protein
MCFYFGVK